MKDFHLVSSGEMSGVEAMLLNLVNAQACQ
jgi:hypothetical protein